MRTRGVKSSHPHSSGTGTTAKGNGLSEARSSVWIDRAHDASRALGLRLRFTGALLLLILPLGAAAWAIGDSAAKNERDKTDTRLDASLRAAASEYARVVDDAQLAAIQLATDRRVQLALRDRDHEALLRLRRANPDMQFLVGDKRATGDPSTIRRSIVVKSGDRVVGRIATEVTLDQATLAHIAAKAGLLVDPNEIAAAVRGNRVVAASIPISPSTVEIGTDTSTVTIGGEQYRIAAQPPSKATRLAVLAPNKVVEDAASSIRGRILAVGLLVLAAVMLIAYLLAPLLARTRVAQQQRAIAERVLEHVADGVLLLDPNGVVRFWNHAAELMTGIPARKVMRKRAESALPGWRAAVQRIPVGDARDGTVKSTTVPLDVGPEELWVDASGVTFADGTVYTFRDITEDERLDQAKTDFVATVSHELRTPLASVYGAAVTLQERFGVLTPEQRSQLLELLAEQASRLSTIIDELLLASKLAGRIDSGQLQPDHDGFDADELARLVVQAAQLRAPQGIELELSTPPWLPHASGDSDKVAQVLANLVENAVKYTPGGGRIAVALWHDDERVRFEVHDPGLGIPLDEQERIFQKFYRLDPNLTRGIGGTGLGLYICRELIRRMGSDIHVESTVGVGSTFWFDLPVAAPVERVAEPLGSA
ncbi:MAG: sensor histidine kinase [Gaiellaceae bacterium]